MFDWHLMNRACNVLNPVYLATIVLHLFAE